MEVKVNPFIPICAEYLVSTYNSKMLMSRHLGRSSIGDPV